MKDEILDERRIAAIAARADGAESGPWKAMLEGRDHSSGSSCVLTKDGGIDFDGASDADIEFIANARQDVLYLVSELRRVVDELKFLRGEEA
jgi:hypothetical protein